MAFIKNIRLESNAVSVTWRDQMRGRSKTVLAISSSLPIVAFYSSPSAAQPVSYFSSKCPNYNYFDNKRMDTYMN